MDAISEIARLIIFILPAYFANSTPVVLGGGMPLDGRRKFSDGYRIFGDSKTVRGFFSGIFAGLVIGVLEGIILSGSAFDIYSGNIQAYALSGLLLGIGTMIGDLLGSFIKRRQNVPPGKPSLAMDQLLFLAVAIIFAYPFAANVLTVFGVVFLFVLTYFVHIGANIIANRVGLKKVPW